MTFNSTFPDRELLDVADLMGILMVSRNTVYRYVQRGVLPASRLGRRLYFRRCDVVRALELHVVRPGENAYIDPTAFYGYDNDNKL